MRWLPKGHPDRKPRTRLELAIAGALLTVAAILVAAAFGVVSDAAARWLGATAFVAGAAFAIFRVRGFRNRQQSTARRIALAAVSLALVAYIAYRFLSGEGGV